MGLINREKRQHAWPARTMAPPTFACAGVRAPRCSLVRCPSHFPKVRALGPEASDSAPPSSQPCLALARWASTGVGGLTAVRPCARVFNSAPPAPSSSSRRTPAARLPRPAPRGSPPLGPPLRLADASSGASGGASGEAPERAADLPLPTVRQTSVDHVRPPSCRLTSANEGPATFARRAPPAVRSVGDSTSAPSCRFRRARRLR